MGLNTTHGCWDGSYSGFSMFRELVGKAAGIPYRRPDPMTMEAGGPDLPDIDWEPVTPEQLNGQWDGRTPTAQPSLSRLYDPPITDPVLYLLIHYDCEGELRSEYLPALKARLEEIAPGYERLAERMAPGYQHLRHKLRWFINGLGAAIKAGEHVDFC